MSFRNTMILVLGQYMQTTKAIIKNNPSLLYFFENFSYDFILSLSLTLYSLWEVFGSGNCAHEVTQEMCVGRCTVLSFIFSALVGYQLNVLVPLWLVLKCGCYHIQTDCPLMIECNDVVFLLSMGYSAETKEQCDYYTLAANIVWYHC